VRYLGVNVEVALTLAAGTEIGGPRLLASHVESNKSAPKRPFGRWLETPITEVRSQLA